MSNICTAFLNYRRHDLAEAMGQQLKGGGHEVFCFDNGGGLRHCPEGIDLVITRSKNVLFSRGWNWAMCDLGAMGYQYVWMLNDDVQGVSQEMLDSLMADFPEGAAAITPAFNSPHALFHPAGQTNALRLVRWVDWTCPLVSVEAWKDVGQFDSQFVGYGADLDWCYRARAMGWSFYVRDDLRVHHLGSQTALSEGLQGQQGNVAEMNRLLQAKWGVSNWTGMV